MQIERERFEAWLFAQPKDRVIEAAHVNKCFLCSFLKETSNINPYFTWHAWYPRPIPDWRDVQMLSIPEWAKELIHPGWSRNNSAGDLNSISVGLLQQRYIELFGDPKKLPVDKYAPGEVKELCATTS